MAEPDFLKRVQIDLIEKGFLIEAGYTGFRLACDLHDAPKHQLEFGREAFFAGAQHLFAAIMGTLDPEAEPTDDDLRRMDLINGELQRFIREFAVRHGLPD
jgi:hypothetical protein